MKIAVLREGRANLALMRASAHALYPYINAVLSKILVTSTNLVSADTIDDVLFDTAIDLILFDGKEVARTYSAFDYDTCRMSRWRTITISRQKKTWLC